MIKKLSVSLLSIICLIALGSFFASPENGLAQIAPSSQVQLNPTQNTDSCRSEIITQVDQLNFGFYRTVDETLKSANLNSESLNYLFRIYRTTQHSLNDLKQEIAADTSGNPQLCLQLLDASKNELQKGFLTAYTQLAKRKKEFLLFEKYDSINNQFEDLQENLRSLDSNVKKFNDLFPCFAVSCLKN